MAGSWRFEAIGTVWTIDTEANLTPATQQAVTACIDDFDQAWSRFRPDSLVSMARESGAPVDVPASSARLRSPATEPQRLRFSRGRTCSTIGVPTKPNSSRSRRSM